MVGKAKAPPGGKQGGGEEGGKATKPKAAKGKKEGGGREVARKAQKFKVGETVLAHAWKSMYEAVVIKVRPEFSKQGEAIWQYFIHYPRWAKKWDEWADETRLVANDANGREVQAEVIAELNRKLQEAAANKGAKGDKKRKAPEKECLLNIDHNSVEPKDKLQRVSIPPALQRFLLDDLDMIEDRKLVALPRTPCLDDVLDMYLKAKKDKSEADVQMAAGLRTFFNVALSRTLLYRFEKPQYKELNAERGGGRKKDSQFYGAEHLLRMMVKLPQLLGEAGVDQEQLQVFQPRIHDLLKYVEKNASSLLLHDYTSADTSYVERVEADITKANA